MTIKEKIEQAKALEKYINGVLSGKDTSEYIEGVLA